MNKQDFLNALPTHIQVVANYSDRIVYINGQHLDPSESLKVVNKSSNGFAWGYEGSGPAQFALALLLLYVPPNIAKQYFQQLKTGWIATLPEEADLYTYVNLRLIMSKILQKEI